MRKSRKINTPISAALLLISAVCLAQNEGLQLPPIFASGMVMQQQDSVTIWGRGDINSNVVVAPGWEDTGSKTVTGSDGKWSLRVATPEASFTPYEMVISSKRDTLVLRDILIGDVWFISGQSNMYASFRGFINQPVYRAQEILLQSNINGIRLFKVKDGSSVVECDTIEGAWQYTKIENVIDFSAVGFVYGKTLYEYLNIPIGLVQCAQSGSKAEAWLDIESLREFGRVDLDDIVVREGLGTSRPTLQYNKMLKPLLPMRIKGVIWYQGEANVREYEVYRDLFPFLITRWREYFDNVDLPFYYVQIAPFSYDFVPGLESQYLREVQLETMKKLDHVGMAVTLDLGSREKIHPPEKELVGKRLAYWALNRTYGIESLACRGPELRSMEVDGNVAKLKFDHSPGGLSTFGRELTGFKVAGNDRNFHEAKAVIETETGSVGVVLVWSDEVRNPVAVRYGFTNYIKGSLFNVQGLPASSFRTDDW